MIDPQFVPESLHHLIPLAERFGAADDLTREAVVKAATPNEVNALKQAVQKHDDLLDAWLVGPENAGPHFSNEYIAFSAMRMAADFAQTSDTLLQRTAFGVG